MTDLIDRQEALDALHGFFDGMLETDTWSPCDVYGLIEILPSAVVRCKDCKHQEKYFYADKRLKEGGRYTYGCDLADGYSHVCLDDDFCSRGEQKDG